MADIKSFSKEEKALLLLCIQTERARQVRASNAASVEGVRDLIGQQVEKLDKLSMLVQS